jgi:lipopolysaccharide export system protein LptA
LGAGCRPPYQGTPGVNKVQATKDPDETPRSKVSGNTININSSANNFTVDDNKGRRLLIAKVDRTQGVYKPGTGVEGPVRFFNAKCKLYQKGVFQLDFTSPECTWDGNLLSTDKTGHGVTADGNTVIDAQQAVWHSDTGHLSLGNANLKRLKNKKALEFTGKAPKAEVENDVVTMPAGGEGWNPEGQKLTGNVIRWNLKNSKLEADGNATVTTSDMTLSGDHLRANTKLEKGVFTGNTKMVAKQSFLGPKKGGGNSKAGGKKAGGGKKRSGASILGFGGIGESGSGAKSGKKHGGKGKHKGKHKGKGKKKKAQASE